MTRLLGLALALLVLSGCGLKDAREAKERAYRLQIARLEAEVENLKFQESFCQTFGRDRRVSR